MIIMIIIIIYHKGQDMETKIFDEILPDEAKDIRIKVFVKEQGFREEFDKTDDIATHIVMYDNDQAIATCRFYKRENDYLLGRIAVIKEYRGKHIGAKLIQSAENEIAKRGGKIIAIHSQLRAKDFYLKQGYKGNGESDFDEGCPHIWVYKNL